VSIGNIGDEVTIRFFTDNPGPWFFHCHIDWHLNTSVIRSLGVLLEVLTITHLLRCSGFAVVFAEDVPDVKQTDLVTRE
jgi:iron transport multicopper oxidase